METRRKDEELAERFLDFSVRIIKLVGKLPKNKIGDIVSSQLLRCGTSPGTNYEEARGAESSSDFIHKLGIVLKELKESRYWLKIIQRVSLLQPDRMTSISDECEELIAIIAKSIFTARKSRERKNSK
ncbi:MAG: four helix bundle protein [Thermodesulfobacteriota bacterium]|nr:four helix bundle protein [Thermodesulfobacteriota bacterium]